MRAAHRPSRRAAIVDAALEGSALMIAPGTIAQIAAAAGVGTAALCYHFESKDVLFTEAVAVVAERHLDLSRSHEDAEGSAFTMCDAVELVWKWAEKPRRGTPRLRLVDRGPGCGTPGERRVRGRVRQASPPPDRAPASGRGRDREAHRQAGRAPISLAMSLSEKWGSGRYRFRTADRSAVVEMLVDLSRGITSTL